VGEIYHSRIIKALVLAKEENSENNPGPSQVMRKNNNYARNQAKLLFIVCYCSNAKLY